MSYRSRNEAYQAGVKRLYNAIEAYYDCNHITEELMLGSYALMRTIHKYLNNKIVENRQPRRVPPLYSAIQDVIQVIGTKDSRISLYYEADKLEDLSRAVFHYLKTKNIIKINPLPKIEDTPPIIQSSSASKDGRVQPTTIEQGGKKIKIYKDSMVYCYGCDEYVHEYCPQHPFGVN